LLGTGSLLEHLTHLNGTPWETFRGVT
jgi:hypothetical protein